MRGSHLEEGASQSLPVWSSHIGDPILQSDITRRVDFAMFMVQALENDDLVRKEPAIVSSQSPSALVTPDAAPGPAHSSAPRLVRPAGAAGVPPCAASASLTLCISRSVWRSSGLQVTTAKRGTGLPNSSAYWAERCAVAPWSVNGCAGDYGDGLRWMVRMVRG